MKESFSHCIIIALKIVYCGHVLQYRHKRCQIYFFLITSEDFLLHSLIFCGLILIWIDRQDRFVFMELKGISFSDIAWDNFYFRFFPYFKIVSVYFMGNNFSLEHWYFILQQSSWKIKVKIYIKFFEIESAPNWIFNPELEREGFGTQGNRRIRGICVCDVNLTLFES